MQIDITGGATSGSAKNKFSYDTFMIVIHQMVSKLYSKYEKVHGELTFIACCTVYDSDKAFM